MERDDLFTPEEIAGKLKLTTYTVYEMIKRGDLDAHRLGKKLRISGEQFEAYLRRAGGFTNTYDAVLEAIDGESVAKIGPAAIAVSSGLEGRVRITIHPEDVILSLDKVDSSANNVLEGTVTAVAGSGNGVRVTLDIGIPLTALITRKSLDKLGIAVGDRLYAIFKAMSVKVYK